MPAEFSASTLEGYQALHQAAGVVELGPRTGIEVAGADRASFLNGFCTNDLKRLEPGQGCEAFVTSAKGRVEGHLLVFCLPEMLVLETAAGQAEHLLTHLDRYLIREDVQLKDVTHDHARWLIGGPHAAAILAARLGIAPPSEICGVTTATVDGHPVPVFRVPWLRVPAFLVACPIAASPALQQALTSADVRSVEHAVIEAARVEAGFPEFGRDISAENLPQEVNRDRQAISFRKGCYLGQETVARLDALGHVNRRLMGLKWDRGTAPPDEPQTLVVGDQKLGRVTSTVWSPRFRTPLSLAYLRRGHDQPGTRLETPWGQAKVIRFVDASG